MRLSATTRWLLSLTVAVTLFYWKLFYPNEYTFLTGSEDVNQALSWFNFWVRSLQHGTLPLWDPYTSAGHSFVGEMQTAAFYPLYLFLLLFRSNHLGFLTAREYNMLYVCGHVLAAFFMFALIRELGLSRFAAFIAGFCFSVGGFVGRVNWPHLLQSAIWGPLIFLFLLRALQRAELRQALSNSVWSGCFLGLSVLAGGLHVAMAQGILALSAAVSYYFVRERAWRRIALVLAVALVAAFCLGAIQLLPSHLYSQHSLRWGVGFSSPSNEKPPYIYQIDDAVFPSGLMMFLFPLFEGMGHGEIWPPYIGVMPFALAMLAIWKCWSHVWVRHLTILGAAAFFYAFAGLSMLHGVLYALVPWLWLAREGTRFLYLTQFALVVLAAYGVDLLSPLFASEESRSLRRILSVLILVCLGVLCLPVFFPKAGGFWQYFSTLLILLSCGLLRRAIAAPAFLQTWGFRALVIALVCFDLNGFNWSVDSRIKLGHSGNDSLATLSSLEGVANFLRAQPGTFRVSMVMPDPKPNIGDAYGIQSVTGAGVTLEKNFYRVMDNFDLLNVRFLIRPASAVDPGAVYQDDDWKVYQNPTAFPRSWLVHSAKVEADDAHTSSDMSNHLVDLRQTALLTDRLPERLPQTDSLGPEQVALRSYSAGALTLSVHARQPALLVLSEMYDPEWQARVNGRSTRIFRTNQAFRSVLVPAGDSQVEFVYRPWSLYLGAFLSLAALLAAAAAAVSLRRGGQAVKAAGPMLP